MDCPNNRCGFPFDEANEDLLPAPAEEWGWPEQDAWATLERELLTERGAEWAEDILWEAEYTAEAVWGRVEKEYGLSCCYRPVWNDSGRCVWHAEVDDKPAEILIEHRLSEPECLDGAYLRGADVLPISFQDCRLLGADLSGINPAMGVYEHESTEFRGADLRFADLSGSYLVADDFSDADLRYANVSGDTKEGGRELSLQASNLSGSNLQKADLSHANLSRANLSGANLQGAHLSNTDLSGANLSEADLLDAVLEEVNLPNADLRGRALPKARLSGATLTNTDVSEADLTGADVSEATLIGANLSGTDLSEVDFTGANLRGATVTDETIWAPQRDVAGLDQDPTAGAVFDAIDFSGLNLRNLSFSGASFRQADFRKADLYKTSFDEADLREAVLDEAICRQATFEYADLEEASFIECDLRSAKLEQANLYHAALTDTQMNLSTTISEVCLYPPINPEEEALESVWSRIKSSLKRVLGIQLSQSHRDEGNVLRTFQERTVDDGTSEDGGTPWLERVDLAEWLERRVWTHQMIHRQLISNGRVRQALREQHYLHEQRERLRKARLELRRSWSRLISGRPGESFEAPQPDGESTTHDSPPTRRNLGSMGQLYLADLSDLVRAVMTILNVGTTIRLVRMSESPLYVGKIILFVTGAFAFGIYPFVGEFTPASTPGWGGSLLRAPVLDAWQLFLFSLSTFLMGTYLVLKKTVGAFLPVAEFEPAGVSATSISGVVPAGLAASVAWVESLLGALLIVPFALLVVQRLRLYLGTAVSEEGLGGGLLSWLLGK